MEQEIYRVEDFCVRYALSRRTFYREIKANRLHVIKRGRRTYIAREDADLWLQNQRHPTAEMPVASEPGQPQPHSSRH
jgi:hypothetical protein